MYNCPHGHGELLASDGEGGRFWLCEQCAGSMITVAILRRIIDRDAINKIWLASDQAARHGPRCPSCKNPMGRVPPLAELNSPPLDVCRPCQLVWFDAMELESLPAPPEVTEPEKPLSPEAREAMARFQLDSDMRINDMKSMVEDVQALADSHRRGWGHNRPGLGDMLGIIFSGWMRGRL